MNNNLLAIIGHWTAPVISMAMSIPALVLVTLVAWKWTPPASRAILSKERSADDWFVIGVAVGFHGLAVNMAWWTAYYATEVTGYDQIGSFLWEWGAVNNNVFRYGCAIAAASCHLQAYHVAGIPGAVSVPRWLAGSFVLGVFFAATIIQ